MYYSKDKSNVDAVKAEIIATVQEGKPAENTPFTKIIGKFVADLFQVTLFVFVNNKQFIFVLTIKLFFLCV